MEIWKDIPSYEGRYQASSLGRIRSLRRDCIMAQQKHNAGYLSVALHKGSHKKTFLVHQLIAMAFLNHKPNGHDRVVDHIDNNPLNNNIENLQLTSQRHNCTKDKKGYSSKYVGVSFHSKTGRWVAKIDINGKPTSLGYFTCELAAAKAYNDKLREVNEMAVKKSN